MGVDRPSTARRLPPNPSSDPEHDAGDAAHRRLHTGTPIPHQIRAILTPNLEGMIAPQRRHHLSPTIKAARQKIDHGANVREPFLGARLHLDYELSVWTESHDPLWPLAQSPGCSAPTTHQFKLRPLEGTVIPPPRAHPCGQRQRQRWRTFDHVRAATQRRPGLLASTNHSEDSAKTDQRASKSRASRARLCLSCTHHAGTRKS